MQFIKLFKFGLVGSLGIVVDFGITWFCKEKLSWNKYLSNAIGFCFACSGNYVLNRIFTFQDHNKDIARQYASFFAISLIGLAMNSLLLYFIQKKTSHNFYVSKIFVTLILFLWNFGANSAITFR